MHQKTYDVGMKKVQLSHCKRLALLLCFVCMFFNVALYTTKVHGASTAQHQANSLDSAYDDIPNSWLIPESKSANDDVFWQKGISADELLRSKMTPSRNSLPRSGSLMDNYQSSRQKEDDEKSEEISIAGGSIKGDATQLGPSWKAPTDQSLVIDEDLKKEKHDVVGAYGEMIRDEGFEMRLGPEVYIPMGGAKAYQGDEKPENVEVGVGMKLLWDF